MIMRACRFAPTFLNLIIGISEAFLFLPLITVAQIPPNDICDQALDLSDSSLASASTSSEPLQFEGSTVEATDDDPNLCGDTSSSKRGVWYLYQNNSIPEGSTAVITVSTCTDITDFDTALTLYQGYCTNLQCINGVDNDPECGIGSNDIHSTIAWHAEPGVRYYILVHGSKINQTGTFGLSLDHDPPLPSAGDGGNPGGLEDVESRAGMLQGTPGSLILGIAIFCGSSLFL